MKTDCSPPGAANRGAMRAAGARSIIRDFLRNANLRHLKIAVVVTDGLTGEPIENATVGPVNNGPGVTTNADGEATLSFPTAGKHRVKAERSDSIRSNSLLIKTS